jgi:hypothetical protein
VTSDTQSNTACGTNALHSVTTGGTDNIAVDASALYSNTTGDDNAGVGYYSLQGNTTGYEHGDRSRLILLKKSCLRR